MRELAWGGGFSVFVLGVFFIFVAAGWPGGKSDCLVAKDGKANTCFCEPFEEAEIGDPGMRQPFNTLSNLYALGTGAILGFIIWRRRRSGLPTTDNRMLGTNFYPITYLLVLIFLGLGSMWFHASIVQWGGVFDQLSMFTYASFLVFYSLVRATNKDIIFYIGYPLMVVVLTVLGIAGIDSLYLIIAAIVPYLVIQIIIWAAQPTVRNSRAVVLKFWLPAVLCMVTATIVWALSQTGGPLCLDTHAFQFHGLWHWLAGAMAFLLYFFWIKAPR